MLDLQTLHIDLGIFI